jgi:hypothetical protein
MSNHKWPSRLGSQHYIAYAGSMLKLSCRYEKRAAILKPLATISTLSYLSMAKSIPTSRDSSVPPNFEKF